MKQSFHLDLEIVKNPSKPESTQYTAEEFPSILKSSIQISQKNKLLYSKLQ